MENQLLRVTYFREIIPAETIAPDFTIEPESVSETSDGLRPGEYLGGAIQGSFSIDYPSFDRWRKLLCKAALGYEAERVWSSPEAFAGEAFYEIIHCERKNVYGPVTSAKLETDFRSMERQVEEAISNGADDDRLRFFMDLYQLFRKAFQVSANTGCTIFS